MADRRQTYLDTILTAARGIVQPLAIVAAAGLVIWGREFGEIAAMVLFAGSVAFALFAVGMYIKVDWRGDEKMKGRAIWKYGQILTWGVLAPAWAVAVGVFIALKMGG